MNFIMTTSNIRLVKFELSHFPPILQNNHQALGKLLGAEANEGWTHFPEAMPFFEKTIAENPSTQWVSYFIVTQDSPTLIGTCGYKGEPTDEGMIEIGYEIRDDFQGKGLATEAAKLLTDNALSADPVKFVQAHTIALDNASTAVLKKLGFGFIQAIEDPDDGTIYQWKKEK